MMNQLQPFMYGEAQVRTMIIDNEPWFVAKDVCDVLEIANPSQAIARLDEDERSMFNIGRQGQAHVVNEPGLYTLILGSRKPEAKQFKRWITHDVIPTIRKTGSYGLPKTFSESLRMLAEKVEENERIAAENERLALQTKEQQRQLKEQEAPVAIYHLAISAQNTMSMQEVAKALGTGRTRLYQILREEGVIMKNSTLPYQRYLDAGYFKVTERPRASGDTIVNDPATRVTAKGFDFIARLFKRRNDKSRLEMEA